MATVICGRDPGQQEQIKVMLKSLVMTNRHVDEIRIHIIADSWDIYSEISEAVATWPPKARNPLKLFFHAIWYPKDRTWFKAYRTPCTTERLYLPVILADVDAVAYVDLDVVFLNSVSNLWKFFWEMSGPLLAGMVAEHSDPDGAYYNSRTNRIPFYGKLGVNAGVILMNLTKIRNFPGGWMEKLHSIYDEYRNAPLHFADQDMLNVLFHFHPDMLLELPCDWNYRTDHCQSKKNTCPPASQRGASLMHGNRGVFLNSDDYTFKATYDAFRNYNWAQDVRGTLLTPLKKSLEINVNSLCGAEPQIFTEQLEKNLLNLHRGNTYVNA